MAASIQSDAKAGGNRGLAWLTVLLAVWIVGGLYVVVYVVSHGISSDVLVSPYHAIYYAGLAALAGLCAALIVRSVRSGLGWRAAFPTGYGGLGVALLLLLAWPVAELGWRDGIGINGPGPEDFLAPSRLLAISGALLVAAAPLWSAYRRGAALDGPWPPAISAALVFIVFCAVGFQPAQALWMQAPLNGSEDDSEIWVMDANGDRQTRLIAAADGFEYGSPVWSPDGSQIAYTRWQSTQRVGQVVADQEIWIASADGADRRQLIGGAGWYWLPHWSPDGAWILYTVDGLGGPNNAAAVQPPQIGFGQAPSLDQPAPVAPNVDVWRIRSDGSGAPERLTDDPAEDRAGVYSPDGSRLLFDSTREGGRTALYVANADGSAPARVTDFGDDWAGTWSPDGSRIAFNANPASGPNDIYVQGYPGGSAVRLTSDPSEERVPSWSPDGSRLAFAVNSDGQSDIWSMAPDGSDRRNLTATVGVSEGMTSGGGSWGRDGRLLYQRQANVRAAADPLVLENLGLTATLLGAVVLAALSVVLVGIGAPFGSITLVLGASTAAALLGGGEWPYLIAAVIAGLVVDTAVRLASARRRATIAGAGSAAAFVLAPGATAMLTTGLSWSITLLVGVALFAAGLGWATAALAGRTTPPRPEVGPVP